MNNPYERDKKWLLDNGFTTIFAEEFTDRVGRFMNDNRCYDREEETRNAVAIDMLLEQ